MAADIGQGEDGHEGDTKYMAKELLNSQDRYPSADIFSLGLTLYEICIAAEYRDMLMANQSVLPSEGTEWQKLRAGKE